MPGRRKRWNSATTFKGLHRSNLLLKLTEQSISCLSPKEITRVHVSFIHSGFCKIYSNSLNLLQQSFFCPTPELHCFPIPGFRIQLQRHPVKSSRKILPSSNFKHMTHNQLPLLVHRKLIFLNKSYECYVSYVSATVIQHFILCRLRAIIF